MNISQFTWTWNSFNFSYIGLFVSAYFRPIKLQLIYKWTSAILSKDKDTHWDIHIYPDRDFTIFVWCLKCLFDLFFSWLEVLLICPKLKSQAEWAVYLKDITVNFTLFPKHVAVFWGRIRDPKKVFNKPSFSNCTCKKKQFCNFKKISF